MDITTNTLYQRKIIHVDMDCFYAAIEIRDNPDLANKPVAVGGLSEQRGVLCTCNYVARKYGIHSAMPTVTAYRKCKDLIVLPVNMTKYKAIAKNIRKIFHEFTTLVEPLALDEAYLDVSNSRNYHGSATLMANAIRQKIWQEEQLTASAGIAPNKFLAKIASSLNKPNGFYTITPNAVTSFLLNLPVTKLFGVGKVTGQKLYELNIHTCSDLQKFSLAELCNHFGKFGKQLYFQCRGIDEREIIPNRIPKSLSVETTFAKDIADSVLINTQIQELYAKLLLRIKEAAINLPIKNQYIKIKYSDFKRSTAEIKSSGIDLAHYLSLFNDLYACQKKPLRLLGLGVHFQTNLVVEESNQQTLF